MKHAGAAALARLTGICASLRELGSLSERKPGIFYRGRSAFLHFHEDGGRLFADLKWDGAFVRFEVTSARQQAELLRRVRQSGLARAARDSNSHPIARAPETPHHSRS